MDSRVQMRLEVRVGAWDWYMELGHDVITGVQTRSEVAVGAPVWKLVPSTQGVQGLHEDWPAMLVKVPLAQGVQVVVPLQEPEVVHVRLTEPV